MNKVVYNGAYGGFSLPDKIMKELAKRKNVKESNLHIISDLRYCPTDPNVCVIMRHDTDLVELVEKYKPLDSIKIKEIEGTTYVIDEYDGWETVIEPKDIKWITIK